MPPCTLCRHPGESHIWDRSFTNGRSHCTACTCHKYKPVILEKPRYSLKKNYDHGMNFEKPRFKDE